jgi:hypothetical protein
MVSAHLNCTGLDHLCGDVGEARFGGLFFRQSLDIPLNYA